MAEEGGLFQNKLFLQYLAATGQDIGSGGAIGTNVNAVTQQNIASQNFKKLMQDMLGPKKIPGAEAKIDDKGVKLNFDQDLFNLETPGLFNLGDMSFDPDYPGQATSAGQATPPAETASVTPTTTPPAAPQAQRRIGGEATPNPFAFDLSSIRPQDLAGLTPAMMSAAMSLGLEVRKASAATAKDTTPASIREYQYAMAQGFDGTFDDWKNKDPTSWQEYQLAIMEDENEFKSYSDFLEFKGKSGATRISIGEKAETKRALGKVEGELYFDNPSKFAKDLDKFLESRSFRSKIASRPDNVSETSMRWQETGTWIQNKISASGGTITNVRWENGGRTAVWSVDWDTGKSSEVRYDIGQKPKK